MWFIAWLRVLIAKVAIIALSLSKCLLCSPVPFHLHVLPEQHQKATLFPSHLISQSFRKERKTGGQVGDITWQQETPICTCRQLALWNSPWLPTALPTHIPGQLYSLRNSYGTVVLPQMLLGCLVTNSYSMHGILLMNWRRSNFLH